jgi:hypothetical protein
MFFYHGVDGPTLCIKTDSSEWLAMFHRRFMDLAKDSSHCFDALSLPIESANVAEFLIFNGEHGDISIDKTSPYTISWTVANTQICNIDGKIVALLQRNKPAHQYLTETEDVLVVLSYREP